ncbi:MAG TPA: hypothetical protein VN811_06075, partial [Thermoanaerobaculia bacterium]|nr:hypothetical protein [Thermoanaerobaculia bacterium]
MTASGSSSSAGESTEAVATPVEGAAVAATAAEAVSDAASSRPATAPPVRLAISAPLPPLPAAWLAGRDRDLLAPLTLATGGAALPPPPRVDRREVARGLERANRSYGHAGAGELAARLADP